MRDFKDLLSHFEVKKNSYGKVQCRCPAHNDNHASLTITDRGDKALIYCHAGCKTADVLSAVGLMFRDLYYGDSGKI